jgi:hypothetical protein
MILAAASAAAVSALGFVSSAARIEVTPTSVHRGDLVRVHGNAGACEHGDDLTLLSRAFVHTHEFASVPSIAARVSSQGTFSVVTRIPIGRSLGHYSITGRCGGGNLGVTAPLRVTSARLPIDR